MYIICIWLLTTFIVKCYLQDPSSNTNQLKKIFHSSLLQVNSFLEDVEQKIKQEREILDMFQFEEGQSTRYMDYDVTDIWWSRAPPAPAPTPPAPTHALPAPNNTLPPGYIGLPPVPNKNASEDVVVTPPAPADIPLPDYVPDDQNHGDGDATTTGRQGPPGDHPPFEEPEWPPPGGGGGGGAEGAGDETTTQWTHEYQVTPETDPSAQTATTNFIFGEVPTVPTPTSLKPFLHQMEEEMERHRAGYFTVFVLKLFEMMASKPREHVAALLRPLERIVMDLSDRRLLGSLRQPLYSTVMSVARTMSGMPGDVAKSQATLFYSALSNRQQLLAADTRALLDYCDTLFTEQQAERMFLALEHLDKYPQPGKSAHETSLELVNSVMEPYLRLARSPKRERLVAQANEALQRRLQAAPPRPPPPAGSGPVAGGRGGGARRSLAGKLKNYQKRMRRITHAKRDKHRHGGRRRRHHRAHAHAHAHKGRGDPLQQQNKEIDHHNKQYSRTNKRNKHRHGQKRFNVVEQKRNRAVVDYRPFEDEDGDGERTRRTGTGVGAAAGAGAGADFMKRKRPKNRLLRKIIEGSDNSDEARRFRVNVYDALYHGNTSGAGAGGGGAARPPRAGSGSGSGSDQEVVLKSHIYKYFGYQPEVDLADLSGA